MSHDIPMIKSAFKVFSMIIVDAKIILLLINTWMLT